MGTNPEDRRALLEHLRAERDTMLENIAEAMKFLADTEKQIAEPQGCLIGCQDREAG